MSKECGEEWKILIKFLWKRFIESWSKPSYVLYFIIVIVIVGTFGVLTEILDKHYCWTCGFDKEVVEKFCFNVTSTALALVTASVIELLFISYSTIEKEVKDFLIGRDKVESLKKGVRIFGLGSLVLSFVFWILINFNIDTPKIKVVLSSILLMYSYFIWWISNIKNKILVNNDMKFITHATLGDVNRIKTKIDVDDSTQDTSTEELNLVNNEIPGDLSDFKK